MAALASIRNDIRYGYAVGRVRVLEGRLLSRSVFERLVDAGDLPEQKRILSETHVGRYLEGAETAGDVERALEASLEDLYQEFLESAGLPPAVITYFRLPYDYANLRLAVKARILGDAPEAPLSSLGSVPFEAFAADGDGLPEDVRTLLTAWDGAEELPVLDDVEAALDRALFGALSAAARASRLRFLRDLTRLRIDLANARLLIRSRAKRLAAGDIASRVVPGGSPSVSALAEPAARMTAEELAGALWDTRALGHMALADLADIERFDLVAAAVLGERMLQARMSPGGADPVLGYVLRREAEVLLLRTAVAGRLAGLDRETIRERLKERV